MFKEEHKYSENGKGDEDKYRETFFLYFETFTFQKLI